ncbi:beta-propeller domain-containing protein [Nocardioides pelophilus]|uniref:beta-propeller domain-containing protein n=1 Tax=Nocardioides pelophilus TaxID=2172019 RepID=UPI001600C717|nr:beta-propeller domain-containing protein [Nocardioides pelophilus]
MTDLEDLWDDLPTGKAPTHDILRAGRKAASSAGAPGRRRHFLLKPLLTAGIATGVVGAFLAGTLVAGDDGGSDSDRGAGDPPGAAPSHVAFQADLEAAESCDELLETYVDRGLQRVTAWGWDEPYNPYWRDTLLSGRLVNEVSDSGLRAPQATNSVLAELHLGYSEQAANDRATFGTAVTKRQQNSDTGTNVQEIGVDEPDLVKTDGELLLRLRDDELVVYDVTGNRTDQLSSIDLEGLEEGEIMLAGDTVVAVGIDDEAPRARSPYGSGARLGTRVLTVSLTDPEAPEVVGDVSYDARLLSARQHGDAVRLVLSSGLPELGFVHPGKRFGQRAALAKNRAKVEKSTIEDWLPTITAATDEGDDEAAQLLDCTDVAIPSDELTLDTVSVVGFDAAAPADVDAIGLAGATDIAYESVDHLYLAASPSWGNGFGCLGCIGTRTIPSVEGGSTYLFDFALDGTRATHVASGEVEGSVADRWAMDEADGVLRVAVGPTSETGNFNSVVTLERNREDLVDVGRLDRLGRNEDLKAVRWFDGLALLVTYRQVDPLYAIDLTDVARPKLIAELKIPGFSSYLHPLGPKRLVGIGEGPVGGGRWGAQAALFNVADLTNLRRMDVQQYAGGTEALAGTDPRSFTFIHDERTVLTVIQDYRRSRVGYLSVLHIVDGELRNRMVQVEYGDDVDQVRAVPMPDGRVVLVTGEDVEFFDLVDRS